VDDFVLRRVPYEHSDAQQLIEEVQLEYVARYGGRDASPVDVAEFEGDEGGFWVGYLDGAAVATGGWRLLTDTSVSPFPTERVAEIKRMYVTPSARGRGVARALLRHLEHTARAVGADWLVLETGMVQPEALALYRSSGYADVPAFGHYACAPLSVHLGRRLV
jgi:GNAT superfamily N-acetyltransferase